MINDQSEGPHLQRAADAIAAANDAGPDESAAGQVYASIAVAEALLAIQGTLADLQKEVKSLKIRLS